MIRVAYGGSFLFLRKIYKAYYERNSSSVGRALVNILYQGLMVRIHSISLLFSSQNLQGILWEKDVNDEEQKGLLHTKANLLVKESVNINSYLALTTTWGVIGLKLRCKKNAEKKNNTTSDT